MVVLALHTKRDGRDRDVAFFEGSQLVGIGELFGIDSRSKPERHLLAAAAGRAGPQDLDVGHFGQDGIALWLCVRFYGDREAAAFGRHRVGHVAKGQRGNFLSYYEESPLHHDRLVCDTPGV